MIKISDLSKIDIKDIDVMKIKDQLLERKELLVQFGLAFVSLIIVISTFSKNQGEVGKLKAQLRDIQSKAGAIVEYKKARSEIDDFFSKVPPPLTEEQIILSVTDLADKNKVKITTFTPAKQVDQETLKMVSIQFSLQAANYKDMVRFVADIERAKSLLQVKHCSVQAATGQGSSRSTENSVVNFRVEVSSAEAKR